MTALDEKSQASFVHHAQGLAVLAASVAAYHVYMSYLSPSGAHDPGPARDAADRTYRDTLARYTQFFHRLRVFVYTDPSRHAAAYAHTVNALTTLWP